MQKENITENDSKCTFGIDFGNQIGMFEPFS